MTYWPRTPFSHRRRSFRSNSSPASTDSSMSSAGATSPPKNDSCPCASARRSDTIGVTTFSKFSNSPRRVYPSESYAPARISDSRHFLCSTLESTFRQKSVKDSKRPCFVLACRIRCTTPAPTLRTAESPYRMRPSSRGVKSRSDSFTSGGSTSIPIRRLALR